MVALLVALADGAAAALEGALLDDALLDALAVVDSTTGALLDAHSAPPEDAGAAGDPGAVPQAVNTSVRAHSPTTRGVGDAVMGKTLATPLGRLQANVRGSPGPVLVAEICGPQLSKNGLMSVVVFDMDGTLTDTEALWDVVRREVAEAEGVAWPEAATVSMMGMSTQEWAAYMVDEVGLPGTAEQMADRVIDTLARRYRDAGIPTLPGAAEAVHRIAGRWRVGLASSSPRVLIDIALDQLGIAGVIEQSLSTEEIGGAGKPAPDVYLEVCRRLGADPAQSVAVEDAPAGIRSAHAAGMAVIAIPPHFHPPTPDVLALATVVIDSLDQLDVPVIESVLEAR